MTILQPTVYYGGTQRPSLTQFNPHNVGTVGATTAEKLEGTSHGVDVHPFRFPPPVHVLTMPSILQKGGSVAE